MTVKIYHFSTHRELTSGDTRESTLWTASDNQTDAVLAIFNALNKFDYTVTKSTI